MVGVDFSKMSVCMVKDPQSPLVYAVL